MKIGDHGSGLDGGQAHHLGSALPQGLDPLTVCRFGVDHHRPLDREEAGFRRGAQAAVQNHPQVGTGGEAEAAVETGVVGEEGATSHQDGVVLLAQGEGPLASFRRGDPLALAGGGGDAAVEAHGPLERHLGTAQDVGDQEGEVEADRLLHQEAGFDLDPRRSQPGESPARDLRVGIAVAGHHADDSGGDHRVGAGRGTAVVGAGLQGDEEGGTSRAVAGLAQGLDLGVRTAHLAVPAASHDLAVPHQDGADPRVGRGAVAAAGGQPEGPPQMGDFSRRGQPRTPGAGNPPDPRASPRPPGRARGA